MPLNDLEIRNAKPDDRPRKLSDGGGLQLWVTPDGTKRWRLAYRFDGAQKNLAIGVTPPEAKRLAAGGQDPSVAKKIAKAARVQAVADTFDAMAAELMDKKRREEKADRTLSKSEWLPSLAKPDIGNRPIAEISAPEVLRVLRAVEARGRHETGAPAARHHRAGLPLRRRHRSRRY